MGLAVVSGFTPQDRDRDVAILDEPAAMESAAISAPGPRRLFQPIGFRAMARRLPEQPKRPAHLRLGLIIRTGFRGCRLAG
ncbi:hypothetical protein [Rhodopila globiformis]|uniref:hypothetical protein n=1 Tax=Rhodopila globiformis TaxID=1071 RepID=UPI0011B0BF57|nr:hypothetical protein [Rhodopila globiformis]